MKAADMISDQLEYFSKPENNFGENAEQGGMYFYNDNKCAVGRLSKNPQLLQKVQDDAGYYSVSAIYTLASNPANKELFPSLPLDEVRQDIEAMYPEDITPEKQLDFLSVLQTSHDCSLSHNDKSKRLESMKRTLRTELGLCGFQEVLTECEERGIL